jgi:hypothetical protein
MELRHIRYFLTLSEERNFTWAAARVGIGQPPVSQQIKHPESKVGAALFCCIPQSRPMPAGRSWRHSQLDPLRSRLNQKRGSALGVDDFLALVSPGCIR